MSMVIACDACGASYRLGESLIRDVRGVRFRCRGCGGFIDVMNPSTPTRTSTNPPHPPAEHTANHRTNNLSNHPVNHPAGNPSDGDSGKEPVMKTFMGETELPAAAQQGKKGWISPAYGVSRAVGLDAGRLARNRIVSFEAVAPEAEHYRMLRTRILQRTEGIQGVTVMVTSALPGEGKTTTSINLAFTFAKGYSQTVLLVDADLKQQRIRELLGFENDKGLADYLLNGCSVSDMVVWPGVEKLTVLSGGRTVAESSEMLGSPGMKSLVEEMKNRYPERYVIFDVAPVLVGADALAFAPLVDCILLVVQAGRTSLKDLHRAIGMLPQEKILGLVLNRDPHPVIQDYYKYKYK